MSSITQIAENAMLNEYETAEECYEFLKCKSNFKSFYSQLDEIYRQKYPGIASLENRIDHLTNALISLDSSNISISRDNKRKTVSKWCKEKAIPSNNNPVEICFALNLSFEESCDFLTKGCNRSYSFNVRSAKDSIYMYCLLKGKSYKNAQDLIKKYNTIQVPPSGPSSSSISSNTNTTRILLDSFKNAKGNSFFANDDIFMNNFLIPNRHRFNEYAKTATRIYYEQKFILQERLIRSNIDDALLNVDDQFNKETIASFEKALIKHKKSINAFSTLISDLQKDITCARDIFEKSLNAIDSILGNTIIKRDYLNDIMPIDALLRNILHDLPYDWSKKDRDFVSYKESSLQDLIQGLTLKGGYEKFEKKPMDNTFSSPTRKIIMLMFFLNYISDWATDDYSKGYEDFFDKLNDILDNCQYATLYHANQYDWLMLRSVCELELGMFDEDDPAEFFFEVLQMSFDD